MELVLNKLIGGNSLELNYSIALVFLPQSRVAYAFGSEEPSMFEDAPDIRRSSARWQQSHVVGRIIELVKTRIPRRFGLNPIRDIQVLCPMNPGGLGARSLNCGATSNANRVAWLE